MIFAHKEFNNLSTYSYTNQKQYTLFPVLCLLSITEPQLMNKNDLLSFHSSLLLPHQPPASDTVNMLLGILICFWNMGKGWLTIE
jgi:hypothetical protein